MIFKYLCVVVLWTKVTTALEGLIVDWPAEVDDALSVLRSGLLLPSHNIHRVEVVLYTDRQNGTVFLINLWEWKRLITETDMSCDNYRVGHHNVIIYNFEYIILPRLIKITKRTSRTTKCLSQEFQKMSISWKQSFFILMLVKITYKILCAFSQ